MIVSRLPAEIGLASALLGVLCGPAASQQPVRVVHPAVLTVDSGSKSSSMLHLSNAGPKPVRISLSAGDFISRTTRKGVNARTRFFGPDDSTGTEVLRVDVPAQDVVYIRVEASNLWEAGESEAAVLANEDTIGRLLAVKYRVPFNVKLRGQGSGTPELSFTRGTDFLIDLQNDDGMTYRVVPVLWLKGHSHPADTLVIPPNGNGTIKITPPRSWFRDASFARPEQTDGVLTLRLDAPGTQSDAGWPNKSIPFKASLMKVGPSSQGLRSFFFILLLLFLGAVASLAVRYWVPNSLSRASLKERLGDLAEKTRMLSPTTSSEIRVGLRVERQRLLQRVRMRRSVSPDLPADFVQIGKRIDELVKHVALTEKVNELWARVNDLYSRNEAPSLVSSVEDDTASIKTALKKVPSSLSELEAVEKRIGATETKIDLLTSGSDEGWKRRLENDFTFFGGERKRLEQEYPQCKHLFDRWWTGAWKDIPSEVYGALDAKISLLRLINRDLDVLKKVDPNREAAQAFSEALKYVEFGPARKALGEIRNRVYQEDVIAALRDPQHPPQISLSHPSPRRYTPIYFSIQFSDRRLESPDALDPVTCEWNFRDNTGAEKGWRVAHYFASAQTYHVSATFVYKGKPVQRADGKAVEISRDVTVSETEKPDQSRAHAEWVQLGIVVIVALLGLMAGAREQLEKLDLIPAAVALFLLGFGADSIKSALAPAKPASGTAGQSP